MAGRRPHRRRLHSSREDAGSRAPVLLLVVALVWATVLLVSQARQLWFFGDDWAFLVGPEIEGSVLEPHNEHWSTLPLLTYRVMLHLFGADHYLAWALMPVLLHLAVGVLLHRLLRRHGLAPWPAVLATLPVVLLAGAIAENPLWPFQIGFLGSVVLGLLGLWVEGPGVLRLASVWLATVASMACSGMALTMMLWLALVVLGADGVRRALVTTVPPTLVYLGWYVGFGRDAAGSGTTFDPAAAVEFTWTGVSTAWQHVVGLPGAGGLVVVAMLLVLLLDPVTVRDRARPVALGGLGAMVVMYVLISLSRSSLGVEAAEAGRYSYVALVMTVPAFGLSLAALGRRIAPRRRELGWAAAALVVVLGATGATQTVSLRQQRVAVTTPLRAEVLAGVALLRTEPGRTFPGATIDPIYTPDVTNDALARRAVQDRLPTVPATRAVLLLGALELQTTVSTTDLGLPRATRLKRHHARGTTQPQQGCAQVDVGRAGGAVDIPPTPSGAQVVLVPSQEGLRLQMLGATGLLTPARLVPVVSGQPVYVGSLSPVRTLRVLLPPGPAIFCADLEP